MTFSLILLAHWVGDFVFQTNQMALNKAGSLKWLSIHVLTYTAVIGFISFLLFPPEIAVQYTLTNGVLHFFTDVITSRAASRYQDQPRVFFPIIGFDQLIHTVTLYLTMDYLIYT